MNTFVEAVNSQEARTANGMKAIKSSTNACVDLFYKIGASRGKNIIKSFVAAYAENKELALRIAQWARDVRGGSGERQVFKDILVYLEQRDPESAKTLLMKVPNIGRWDDIFVFQTPELKSSAYTMLGDALREKNGLAAKWTPRQGPLAAEIRRFFGMSPKFFRKSLVEMTKVVEQQMCAKEWDEINFSHVPSVAHARYKNAFIRNTPKYKEYVAELIKDPKDRIVDVKINAGAVYPYDVLRGLIPGNLLRKLDSTYNKTELDVITAQWNALENFMGDADVLPLIDVSGSMTVPVGESYGISCLEVAVSLGLYCADKNKGKFKDTFLTFSSNPELLHLKGDIIDKVQQITTSTWGMSTNLVSAMNLILRTALNGNVSQSEMPKMLLIFSDMQFDECAEFDDSAMQMIGRKFAEAGYEVPAIVFWNLNSNDNVPVKANAKKVALVSGFSPSIMKSILSADTEKFTPEGIMLNTVMIPRYDI